MTSDRKQIAAGNEGEQEGHGREPGSAGADASTRAPGPTERAPSHAERARTLAQRARWGTLSTIARDPAGFPYGSLLATAVDAEGRPLLLISRLAEHTKNLEARPEASILLVDAPDPAASPLAQGRVTLLGLCRPVPAEDTAECRRIYLAAHPDAARYEGFGDFSYYRLEPTSLRYIAGFGRMSWIDAEAYRRAAPDPLAEAAAPILGHMNDDHADAVLAYARALAGIADATSARMTGVDRYGFELLAETPAGARPARVTFEAEVTTRDEARKALVALAQRAMG